MFILKLSSKIITLALLTSLVGTQLLGTQAVFAQNYDLVPPAIDQNDPLFENLPSLDINQPIVKTAPLRGQVSTAPVGTTFEVTTNTTVGSAINAIGDIFTATLTSPIAVGGNVVVPAGSEAVGQITYIENSGRVGKNGVLQIKFTNIKTPNGPKVPVSGKIVTTDNSGILKGGSIKKQIATGIATEAVITGGGTLTGLTIGSIASHAGGGALLGTTAGGFLGLGYILGRKGKEVVLPSGSKMNVILDQPLTIGN